MVNDETDILGEEQRERQLQIDGKKNSEETDNAGRKKKTQNNGNNPSVSSNT